MPKNKAINLLPQEEFNISTTGRILSWATGTFRIIVIITEIVVMGAFLSRFWLDAQNSDLKNSIKIKTAQITAQADLEKRFRTVQSKLNVYSQIANSQDTSKKVEGIVSKLPPNITLSNISLSANTAQVKGISGSDVDIAQFVANLGTDKSFKRIELGQVSSSETGSVGTIFSVNISF